MSRAELFRDLFGATSGALRVPALRVLIEAYPECVTTERLAATLWPARPPTRPADTVRVVLSQMRHDLAARGWTISRNAGGSAPGGDREAVKARYRLVRLP